MFPVSIDHNAAAFCNLNGFMQYNKPNEVILSSNILKLPFSDTEREPSQAPAKH